MATIGHDASYVRGATRSVKCLLRLDKRSFNSSMHTLASQRGAIAVGTQLLQRLALVGAEVDSSVKIKTLHGVVPYQ
ncbi:hypothetical protein PSAB6_460023 [Paraburkholderia sabiae]|nr:hypothetical protein PSAB6_460023 [Paraburkholderia sabiae]